MEPLDRVRRSVPGRLPAALALLVALALPGAVAAQDAQAQEAQPELPRPCEDDPRHRQLDFWVGEWRVLGADGREPGTSRVRSRHGGCVIEEEWSAARGGGSGVGMSFVDGEDGRWRQLWVGSTGTVVRSEGELRDGAMRFQGRTTEADGTVTLSRATLEPIEGGRVRQLVERSADGGTTWSRYFEGTYVPASEALPMPMPTRPEPAPSTERSTERSSGPNQVTVVSVEVPDEEVPIDQRPKRHLQSPMVLEVPVGPVEALPEGYSWSTDETAQYVVEEAIVRKVSMARKSTRNAVELPVTVTLYSSRFLHHGDLGVELLSDGEVIASGVVDDFALGRSLPAQGDGPGLERRLVLSLERETFDAAFGGAERPVLRITLTIRE